MGHKTYTIGDTHGRFDLLGKCLLKIHELTQESTTPHTVVFLGDYIDRGPRSSSIIDRIRGGPSKAGKWVAIQGNHEAMMVNSWKYGKDLKMWLSNGGNTTLLSYGAKAGDSAQEALDLIPKEDIDFIMTMPILHVDKHRVYVHAYIDRNESLYEQRSHRVQWEIWPSYDEGDYHGLHIVHGHEQIEDGPMMYQGRTNMDTGSYYTGRQYIGVFDDDVPGGPIGMMEIRE